MNQSSDQFLKYGIYAGAAVGTFFVLKAIANFIIWLTPYMLATWVIVVLQIVGILCSTAIATTISIFICQKLIQIVIQKIAILSIEQKELLKKFRDRTPSLVITTVIFTQAVMVIVDKAFGESPVIIVVVSILLVILFFAANQMMVDDSRFRRTCGWIIWILSIFIVPVFVSLHYGWTPSQLWEKITALSPGTLLIFILLVPVALIMPYAMRRK